MRTMDQLKPGETGTVVGEAPGELLRLGLAPGTEVRCLRRSPLGDPTVYGFRGAVYALRNRDAASIRLADRRPGP